MPEQPSEAAVQCSAWLADLLSIIKKADKRSLQIHAPEVKWLVELPMTDAEYSRWQEITNWHE